MVVVMLFVVSIMILSIVLVMEVLVVVVIINYQVYPLLLLYHLVEFLVL
jgi:hypothetical protein